MNYIGCNDISEQLYKLLACTFKCIVIQILNLTLTILHYNFKPHTDHSSLHFRKANRDRHLPQFYHAK